MTAMKYAIIIPDGCADEPLQELSGKTPLQAARLPNMDAIAEAGVVGLSNNVPAHLPAGSDVANLSLLGYSPLQHFTGRAPIEAAAQNIPLGSEDWAVRCNLVTIENQIMRDFTAGHIGTDEARSLLKTAQERCGDPRLEFVTGVSYRNLLIYRATKGDKANQPSQLFTADTRTTPPHDLTDKPVVDDFPRGPGSDFLTQLMDASKHWFEDHPVNQARRKNHKPIATNVWLWGQGKAPTLENFSRRHGVQGAMITAVDLLRGLARLIGWDCIEVPGATGYLDTDYAAKGKYAVEALSKYDLVCVHVEATDEASHEGKPREKIAALEAIDQEIVGPVWHALKKHGEYRILISPDHPTPIHLKTHSHGDVPFAICGTGIQPGSAAHYDEFTAARSGRRFAEGWNLMAEFLNGMKT